MRTDPSIDVEQLNKHFGKNYSEMLRMRELNRVNQSPETIKIEVDNHDRRLIKEGRLDFIGIEPRVNTNR